MYLLAAVVAAVVLVVLTVRAVKSGGSAATAVDPAVDIPLLVDRVPCVHAARVDRIVVRRVIWPSLDDHVVVRAEQPVVGGLPAGPAQDRGGRPGRPRYKVGDEPVVMLQVTNIGTANCTEDLADPQDRAAGLQR